MPHLIPLVLAQVSTTVPATNLVLTTPGNEEGRAAIGTAVFGVTVAIIVVAALVLILRNRGRGINANGSAPSRPPAAPAPEADAATTTGDQR